MMEAPTVTLAGLQVQLERPGALAALSLSRDEAALNGSGIIMALGAAALLICWPESVAWPARPRPRPWRVGQSLESLGHSAFDQLIEAGADLNETIVAASAAYTWAIQSLIKEEEVLTAVNFSDPPEAAED